MKKIIFIVIAALQINFFVSAQSAGDYRSINNGNWNDATMWEIYNGTNWISSTTYPGQNASTGAVTIMDQTEIKITASVPFPVSSLYVNGEYVCECFDGNSQPILFGTLTFSAQSTVSLIVSGSVTVFGELRIDDQNGAKSHSLSIGGSLGVGDMWWDYYYYYTPTVFQTINQDDKLDIVFNTIVPSSAIWGSVSLSFPNVTFNGIGISLAATIDVEHANFINGILMLDGGTIRFGDNANADGASNVSYVDGMVWKTGDDPFTFPIGRGNVYAPLSISAPADPVASVGAWYTTSDASNLGQIEDPGLINVSNCEYWWLTSNNNILDVTLNWSPSSGCEPSPYVANVSDVTVAHFDQTSRTWDSHGGSGIGSTTSGSVTWNGVSSDGILTLANLGSCNAPLGTSTNITSNSAILNWTAISGAASYDVDYREQSNTNGWFNAATATTATSVNVSGLIPLTSYIWRVRTNCGSSSSSYRHAQFTTLCGSPSALWTSNITSTSATLNWAAVPNASNYAVEYKQSTSTSWITSAPGIPSTSYTLNGLSASTTYNWRIRVNCYPYNTGNYTQSSFTTQSLPQCSDVYEPNNTSGQAKSIVLGTAISGMISSIIDIDWFKITSPNSSNAPLEVVLGNLPADYDLYVYNKTLTQVGGSINTSTSNEVVVFNSNARKATYYIKVIGKNGATNISQCYNLIAKVYSSTQSKPSASQPGFEIIRESTNQVIYPNPTSEYVYLRFNSPSEGVTDLQILNSVGQLVKRYPVNITRGYNQVRIPVNDIRPGAYLLRLNKDELKMIKTFVVAR